MMIIPFLLAICFHLATAWYTYVAVNYTLTCPFERHQFNFSITLMELDNSPSTHDWLKRFTHQAIGHYEGFIWGEDDGDLSPNYEFALKVEHDCGGQSGVTMRELPDCDVSRPRCDTFETQHFVLLH